MMNTIAYASYRLFELVILMMEHGRIRPHFFGFLNASLTCFSMLE
jgi:hypothetical protein